MSHECPSCQMECDCDWDDFPNPFYDEQCVHECPPEESDDDRDEDSYPDESTDGDSG